MNTKVNNELSIKTLETIIGEYKLRTEARLDVNNSIIQVQGTISKLNNEYICNFNGNENAGKLNMNMSVQDNSERTVCSEMIDKMILDIGVLFPII